MEMTAEIRKQLMEMAGIQDVAEFEQMMKQFAPKMNSSTPRKPQAGETSPFQVHFIKLVAMVEAAGIQKFMELNGDIKREIEHVFSVANSEYADIRDALPKDTMSKENHIDGVENSKTYRDKGNKAYAKKDLDNAIGYYCKAIFCAPLDADGCSRETSLSLGNRSAVWLEMGEWKKCISDIEAAILFGYPQELVYKLHERKGKCLFEFHGFPAPDAIQALNQALETVNESKLNETKRVEFCNSIKLQLNDWNSIKVDSKKLKSMKSPVEDGFDCPFKISDTHATFPPLSDSIDITYDDENGRYVKAKKYICAGEAVVIEEPVAAHLSRSFADTNCTHCLRKCGRTVLPSPLVPDKVKFCSMRCLKIAMETYHKVESRISIAELFYAKDESEKQQQMSGCISLAYRAITQKGLNFFKENEKKLFTFYDTKFGVDTEPGFSYTGDEHYRGLFNLVNHNENMSDMSRIRFIIRTIVLLKCLQGSGFFGDDVAVRSTDKNTISNYQLSEDELYIGRLLFHFQTGIQYNLHAVYQVDENNMEAGKKLPLTDIGAGCYPTTIFFNHSCAPNTVRINMGKRVVYVAKRNIVAGEEVTDCYGIHHLSIPLEERQNLLTTGYVFKCLCEACQKNFPTLDKLTGEVTPEVGIKLGNSFTKYKNLFGEKKYEKALAVCQEYLCRLEELKVPFPHRNYELAAVALCSCLWAIAGNAAHNPPKKD